MFSKFFAEVKLLKSREKLLLALVFSLPFERIPSFDLGGLTIKLSLIIGAFLIITCALDKTLEKKTPELRKLAIIPSALLGYSLLSILWSSNLTYWLKANLILGFMVALFYTVIVVVSEQKNKAKFINLILRVLLASALAIIAFGFFQWFGDLLSLSPKLTGIRPEYTASRLGLPRMHSVLLEPLYFGLFLLLSLGLLWADKAGVLVKNLYLRFGLITLIYLATLLSLARGAIVASAAVGLLGLIYNFRTLKEQITLKDLGRIIGLVLVGLVFLVGTTTLLGKKGNDQDDNYAKGFSTIIGHLETIKPWSSKKDVHDQNSINSRDVARNQAWDLITMSPKNFVFGVGAGQYGDSVYPKQGFKGTSNFVLLDSWANYGLVGVLLVATFLVGLIALSLKYFSSANLESVLVIGVGLYLIGFLIQSITFGELAITHLWVATALLVGTIESEK